jgi:hypothetical protein
MNYLSIINFAKSSLFLFSSQIKRLSEDTIPMVGKEKLASWQL